MQFISRLIGCTQVCTFSHVQSTINTSPYRPHDARSHRSIAVTFNCKERGLLLTVIKATLSHVAVNDISINGLLLVCRALAFLPRVSSLTHRRKVRRPHMYFWLHRSKWWFAWVVLASRGTAAFILVNTIRRVAISRDTRMAMYVHSSLFQNPSSRSTQNILLYLSFFFILVKKKEKTVDLNLFKILH